jgi:transglutaminase-like putative cysteine protease
MRSALFVAVAGAAALAAAPPGAPGAALAAPQVSMSAEPAPPPVERADAPRLRTFELRYEATLRDIPGTASAAYLWIPYPPDTEDQQIRDLAVDSSMPYEIVREPRYGNRALRFMARSVPEAQRATLRVIVARRERVRRPVGALPTIASAPPGEASMNGAPAKGELQAWLAPDRRVPINGKVREWALETTAGRARDLEKARAIYDYVVSNLRYDKSGIGWGQGDIFWACDARRGNCTDFHAVFIGYSRALGIPARFEMGFPIPAERGQGEIAGYHCWAQFHLADQGWIPVDASEANKNPLKREYFFGAHDENRILLSVGRDLIFPGMRGEPLNFFIYPYAEVDGAKYGAVAQRFSYHDVDSPSTSVR